MRTKKEVKQYLKDCKDDDKKYGDTLETEEYAILRTQIEMLEWCLK